MDEIVEELKTRTLSENLQKSIDAISEPLVRVHIEALHKETQSHYAALIALQKAVKNVVDNFALIAETSIDMAERKDKEGSAIVKPGPFSPRP